MLDDIGASVLDDIGASVLDDDWATEPPGGGWQGYIPHTVRPKAVPPVAELPAPLAGLREDVDRQLREVLDPRLQRVASLHPELEDAVDELTGVILSGGKRLRPVLLLAGHRCAGGDPPRVMGPALALELLHTCAILHDDLIDGADTRRGRTTTHERFAERHRARGWAGSATAYGGAAAILLGDLALVVADELFCAAEVEAERILEAMDRFTVLREEVVAGQYLDVTAAHSRTTSSELVQLIATTKSGRYSISRPLQIGATLAGADDELLEALAAYGEPLGRAFQVRDDLLGVFGDEATTGKSAASDLREGKRTLLVVEALGRLGASECDEFERLLGDPELDRDGIERLRELLRSSGALPATRAQIDEWTHEAREAAGRLPLEHAWRATFRELAGFIAERRA